MDSSKYDKLRNKVLDIMNKHTTRRHCHNKICPSLELPNHVIKNVFSLEKEDIIEMNELVCQSSPPNSPNIRQKKIKKTHTVDDFSKLGIIITNKD